MDRTAWNWGYGQFICALYMNCNMCDLIKMFEFQFEYQDELLMNLDVWILIWISRWTINELRFLFLRMPYGMLIT